MGKRRPIWGPFVAGLALAVIACAPASSLADSAVVLTGTATNVTTTSATLNGMASSNISGSSWYFQFGTSPTYGHSTSPTLLTTNSVESVSANITGLLPGITYHYRLVVAGPYMSEVDYGRDATFTTPASPGSVATTGQATGIKANSVQLNGVVNTSDQRPQWFFQYGRTRTYGRTTATHSIGPGLTLVAAKVTGLRPHTHYHFRLVVEQSQGPIVDGRDSSFKTAKSYGHATVRSHRLKIRHGTAKIPFLCAGRAGSVCDARVSLKTQTTINNHLTVVGCGRGRLAMRAVHRRNLAVKLGPQCSSLLDAAPHGQLRATLTAVFSSHQRRLRTTVTLLNT